MDAVEEGRIRHHAAGVGLAAITVILLAGCGSSTAGTGGAVSPSAQPTTTATSSTTPVPAQPACPLTQAQVDQAFGQTLPGPQAPLNAYEVCVFGQATPGNYHVVTIAEYNAATLAGFGSTASAYFESNRGSTAVTVANVGLGAYIKGGDIWVETPDNGVLDIGSDFEVTHAALVAAALAALPQV